MIWLFWLPPRMTISHSTMNYRKVMTKLNENNVTLGFLHLTNISILELFLDMTFSGKKYWRQPSIDFDFCNLSSSGDVQCSLQGTNNSRMLMFVRWRKPPTYRKSLTNFITLSCFIEYTSPERDSNNVSADMYWLHKMKMSLKRFKTTIYRLWLL
jgi:hypothetical protein